MTSPHVTPGNHPTSSWCGIWPQNLKGVPKVGFFIYVLLSNHKWRVRVIYSQNGVKLVFPVSPDVWWRHLMGCSHWEFPNQILWSNTTPWWRGVIPGSHVWWVMGWGFPSRNSHSFPRKKRPGKTARLGLIGLEYTASSNIPAESLTPFDARISIQVQWWWQSQPRQIKSMKVSEHRSKLKLKSLAITL